MSAASLCQPTLTRIAVPASAGGTPIAARTCERPTLPDEQAAPALTAMPARSSAMTWTSFAVPAVATHTVFGTRAAFDPRIVAAGAICRWEAASPTVASRSSRG